MMAFHNSNSLQNIPFFPIVFQNKCKYDKKIFAIAYSEEKMRD